MNNKTSEIRIPLVGRAFDSSLKSPKFQKKSKKAFTVAEVLITLAVIGVVASLVVPMIKLKYQEMTTVAKLRRVYSLMNSSFNQVVLKYGTPNRWNLVESYYDEEEEITKSPGAEKFLSLLAEGLNAKNISNEPPFDSNYMNDDGKQVNVDGRKMQPFLQLQDGTIFFHGWVQNTKCTHNVNKTGLNNPIFKTMCGDFRIDLNGINLPNVIGIDQFEFRIGQRGIVPTGMYSDFRSPEYYCIPNKTVEYNGYGCTAWAIEKGTMPWLYGKQVSWEK